jgi:hypothetical protein
MTITLLQPNSSGMIQLACQKEPINTIEIKDAEKLSSAALSAIAHVGESLKALDIRKIPQKEMRDDAAIWIFNILKGCPSLEKLWLGSVSFRKTFLDYLGKYGKQLRDLGLFDFSPDDVFMTDDSFKSLIGDLPQLQSLYLCNFPKLTSKGLTEIKELRNLKQLFIERTPGVDDQFVHQVLKELHGLITLKLYAVKISSLSIASICQLKHISYLNLHGCKNIPAKDFVLLNVIESLKKLVLTETRADDAFLSNPPPNLQALLLVQCPVTPAAIASYQNSHPHVYVVTKGQGPENQSAGWFSSLW